MKTKLAAEPTLALTLLVAGQILSALLRVGTVGLGERVLHHEGALLDAEYEAKERARHAAAAFGHDQLTAEVPDEGRLAGLLRQLQVEVVAPRKELARMMNEVSTKSRAMLLHDQELYFNTLDASSASRPMLLAYLGLELTGSIQLERHYAKLGRRMGVRVVDNCRQLLAQRHQLHEEHTDADSELLAIIGANPSHRRRFAQLIFKNNLNLFMLESYLLLCSRLEPKELARELRQTEFLLAPRHSPAAKGPME